MILTGQTGSLGPTTLFTPALGFPAGIYIVGVYQVCSNGTGTTGNVATTIRWTDDSNTAQSIKPAADLSLNAVGNFQQGLVVIEVKTTTSITFQTVVSGISGAPQYLLAITVVKVS